MCSMSLKMKVIELAPVENISMYIAVADATFGGSPRLKSKGLKIEPPPRPRAPDTKPPANESTNTLNFLPTKLASVSTKPLPYLILSDYSCSSTCRLLKLIEMQNIAKTASETKSAKLQVLIPKMDGFFFEPLKRSTNSRRVNKQTFNIYFFHWP